MKDSFILRHLQVPGSLRNCLTYAVLICFLSSSCLPSNKTKVSSQEAGPGKGSSAQEEEQALLVDTGIPFDPEGIETINYYYVSDADSGLNLSDGAEDAMPWIAAALGAVGTIAFGAKYSSASGKVKDLDGLMAKQEKNFREAHDEAIIMMNSHFDKVKKDYSERINSLEKIAEKEKNEISAELEDSQTELKSIREEIQKLTNTGYTRVASPSGDEVTFIKKDGEKITFERFQKEEKSSEMIITRGTIKEIKDSDIQKSKMQEVEQKAKSYDLRTLMDNIGAIEGVTDPGILSIFTFAKESEVLRTLTGYYGKKNTLYRMNDVAVIRLGDNQYGFLKYQPSTTEPATTVTSKKSDSSPSNNQPATNQQQPATTSNNQQPTSNQPATNQQPTSNPVKQSLNPGSPSTARVTYDIDAAFLKLKGAKDQQLDGFKTQMKDVTLQEGDIELTEPQITNVMEKFSDLTSKIKVSSVIDSNAMQEMVNAYKNKLPSTKEKEAFDIILQRAAVNNLLDRP